MRQEHFAHCVDCGAEKDDHNLSKRCGSCSRRRSHRARRLRAMHPVIRRIVAASHMVRRYVDRPDDTHKAELIFGYASRLESHLAELAEALMAEELSLHCETPGYVSKQKAEEAYASAPDTRESWRWVVA